MRVVSGPFRTQRVGDRPVREGIAVVEGVGLLGGERLVDQEGEALLRHGGILPVLVLPDEAVDALRLVPGVFRGA
nr:MULTISPECIES: hypothetical protein [Streptomyces]